MSAPFVGGYGRWGFVEPSRHIGSERCAVMDTEVEMKFGDEMCFKAVGFVCDIGQWTVTDTAQLRLFT